MSEHIITADGLQQYHNGAVKPLKERATTLETLTGSVEEFETRTISNKYTAGEYVLHVDNQNKMKVWKCKENGWYGAWNEEGWEMTNLWDEIREIRGHKESTENVKVKVTINRGTGVVAGTTITVIFDAAVGRESETLTLDTNGEASFGVTIGDKYWVRCNGLEGYRTPNSEVFTAAMSDRIIEYEYRMLGSGIYFIDANGYETDVELWNPATQTAVFLKLTNTTLNPGGLSHDNSIIIDVNYATPTMAWCIEYKDFTSLTNFNSSATAITDMNGALNSQRVREEASTPNAAGKTYVDIYNESHPDAEVDLAGYIPAFMYAYNKTVSVAGQTVHGYVLSAGQMQILKDNITDVNAALTYIGKPTLNINSGYRWSSTEYSGGNAWYLYNGSWYSDGKTYTNYSVLPAYDLSDIL